MKQWHGQQDECPLDDDKVYYKCTDKKIEAYGSTPEEAYEMWNQLSTMTGWRMEIIPT